MYIIGLTGPTGSGKTTFAAMLRTRGFYVADGDTAARAVVRPGSPLLARLADAFGADILTPDGALDRALTAKRAFSTPENVRTLNALMHPAIEQVLFDEIARQADCPAAVIDAAALIESGIADRCDLVAVALAPREVRLARIMQRDALTAEQAETRMRAQPDDAFYTDRADVVLHGFAPYDPEAELQKLLERIPV